MKALRILAISLLFFVSLNALVSGYLFMSDPSGSRLGTSVTLLRFTGFENFFLPGLILFLANGVLGAITVIALIRCWAFYQVRLSLQGFLLTGWIVIQVLLIREFNFLHAIMGVIGIFFIVTGTILLKHPED